MTSSILYALKPAECSQTKTFVLLEDKLLHTPGVEMNLFFAMAEASYLMPLFTTKPATPAASVKVGIMQPIWLTVRV
jgi:hypothetical protein